MPDAADLLDGRFTDLIGREHARTWTASEIGAWTGLMATVEAQQRGYAADLERALGLSPSAAGLLGRLEGTGEGVMRLSKLACGSGLSLSRVSRIVDGLEGRGFVTKRQCSGDGRATNVHLTAEGATAAAAAQAFLNVWLRERFFGRLTADETHALAGAFRRLATEGAGPVPGAPCEAG